MVDTTVDMTVDTTVDTTVDMAVDMVVAYFSSIGRISCTIALDFLLFTSLTRKPLVIITEQRSSLRFSLTSQINLFYFPQK